MKINQWLQGIDRVEWLNETQQQAIVDTACSRIRNGDRRTFRDIAEDLVFITSITTQKKIISPKVIDPFLAPPYCRVKCTIHGQ